MKLLIQKQETCPKCGKGFISKRTGSEDQFIDFDVPVLNKNGDGMYQTHTAICKDGKGKVIYENGVAKTISWEEPITEKIFVLKSTSDVIQTFCSNAMCDYNVKDYKIVKEYDIE